MVVDDSPVDRALVAELLRTRLGAAVETASNGLNALESIARKPPDIVLTDLQMPHMDGLSLVRAMRREFPFLPVILMTAYGSERIALDALRSGAASFVNKHELVATIIDTIHSVLSVAHRRLENARLAECWENTSFQFTLRNDATLIPVVVNHLQQYLTSMCEINEAELVHVGVALHEALRNAMHHGNLELESQLRQQDPAVYYNLAQQRSLQPPYRDRRVYLTAIETPEASEYIIRDEGPGFAVGQHHTDLSEDHQLELPSGRGLFLIRTFMQNVRFNESGNQISFSRRRNAVDAVSAAAG